MRRASRILYVVLPAFLAAACEGSGDAGDGLEIRNEPIAPNCTPAAGTFPSGLAMLSVSSGRAVLVQTNPPGLVVYDINGERPRPLAFGNIGADSDSDGIDDRAAIGAVLGIPLSPVMGEIQALRDDLALVSTSNYEQILVYDPTTATPIAVVVEVPPGIPAGDYPLLPQPGTAGLRTGISTLACVFPPDPVDSSGRAIGSHPACGSGAPSYLTTLTAGKTLAAGRLFVATSNLDPRGGDRFRPGTVLVYEWAESRGLIIIRPDPLAPTLFTTAFNPTGIARILTPGGRELVLVTLTGVIGTLSGPGNVLTEAAIDVIDPSVPRIAATIPLGFAGPSFEKIAVEPGLRLGWLGASSQRQIYAVDLRALDDPLLYSATGPPVILDGLTVGAADARVFTGDQPFVLPNRPDGPPVMDCDGFTHVAVNSSGSEAFATDFCDGTITRVRIDLSGTPPVPYPRDRFQLAGQSNPFSPNHSLGLLRSPSVLAVRPGVPGVDYTSPDVFVVVGQPDAQLCALRVESF